MCQPSSCRRRRAHLKSRYGQKQTLRLHEQARLRALGLRGKPKTFTPLTLAQTIAWARRVPRSARVAQGFRRIDDFARRVKLVRAKRAELRRCHPHPLRQSILETLERVLYDRDDLMKAARREARAHWGPHFESRWGRGKPRVYDSVRNRYPMRDVAVPAVWLLARLDHGPNIAARMRQADPRPRILSSPHWIDRVAAGALRYHPTWLTAAERALVKAR